MKCVKYLIIGAGISGLSFANFINDDDYLIIDRNDEPGGYCRTFYNGKFVWDFAGHFFHFSTDVIKEFFNQNVNTNDVIFNTKNTKIFYKGNFIDYPFQMNIHQLDKADFIDCLYDLFNKTEKVEYSDFLEMLYGKFGFSIVEKFLKPYNEKLYACDLRALDKDAMGRFFPYANKEEIINNMKRKASHTYNDEFLYHKRGARAFVDVLLQHLNKHKILLEEECLKIDTYNKVVGTQSQNIYYEYLINTAPFDWLLSCVNKEEYSSIKTYLTANKVLVLNLGFDKPANDRTIHWLYFPNELLNFYRVGFYSNILKTTEMSLYIEVGFPRDAQINIDEQLEITLENLRKVGIVNEHKLIAYNSLIMDPAYVHINEHSQDIVRKYKVQFEKNYIYTIGRYGDWKYCSIEDCIIDAISLAKKLAIKS